MELKFSNTVDSADRLDEIMNSYPGRDRGSVMADEHSLVMMLTLLEHGKITVTEHSYSYDLEIRSDNGMMEVYRQLARETRWKQSGYTEIERMRINALRQMCRLGKPSYDGEFMCWQEGRICAHCGNLSLPRLLLYLADHEIVKQFYIFTYPCFVENQKESYYRFDLSETAVRGAKIYRESIWDKLRKASEAINVYPTIYQTGDEPASTS